MAGTTEEERSGRYNGGGEGVAGTTERMVEGTAEGYPALYNIPTKHLVMIINIPGR